MIQRYGRQLLRRFLLSFVFIIGLIVLWPLTFAETAQPLPKVKVDPARRCFVTEDGRVFVPFGVNYFRPGTGWAPQVWKRFDPAAVRADFRLMKEYGINCVRVFLTFDSFYRERGQLEPFGLERWEQFLEIAEEFGIYVHPTGPDHWEGLPPWARGDTISNPQVVEALAEFWKLFASRYRGRNVIFAYDLRNEPSVPWESTALREKWPVFLRQKYVTLENLAKAWGVPSADVDWDRLPVPSSTSPQRMVLDYQSLREELADYWTRCQVEAIKAADPDALVTVGLIQWSVPVVLPELKTYSAFRPERQARYLDFLEVHFYPLARGFYDYQREEDHLANLAYVEAVVREVARAGKPVVVAEFGWYGGGKLTIGEGRHPPATEEQQARWCTDLVTTTRELACGWLNWGVFDHPEARDVTQLTGLFRVDGTPKVWANGFRDLSRGLASTCCMPWEEWERHHSRPTFDWDQAISRQDYARAFRDAYYEAFRKDLPHP